MMTDFRSIVGNIVKNELGDTHVGNSKGDTVEADYLNGCLIGKSSFDKDGTHYKVVYSKELGSKRAMAVVYKDYSTFAERYTVNRLGIAKRAEIRYNGTRGKFNIVNSSLQVFRYIGLINNGIRNDGNIDSGEVNHMTPLHYMDAEIYGDDICEICTKKENLKHNAVLDKLMRDPVVIAWMKEHGKFIPCASAKSSFIRDFDKSAESNIINYMYLHFKNMKATEDGTIIIFFD